MEDASETYDDFRSLYHQGKLFADDNLPQIKKHILSRLARVLNWCSEDLDDFITDSISTKLHAEAKLKYILYMFQKWKLAVGEKDIEEQRSLLISYSLVKLCFYDWIEDSSLVGEVLNCIYALEGHFSGIFHRIINESEVRTAICSMPSNTTPKGYQAFATYFLHHAAKMKLAYDCKRFVDLELKYPMQVSPVVAAAVYLKPEPLLLFLRYGAYLQDSKKDMIVWSHGEWNVPLLLRHLLRILWSSLGSQMVLNHAHSNGIVSTHMQKTCLCIRILLRAARKVHSSLLDFTLLSFEEGRMTKYTNSERFICWVSMEGLVPNFAARCFEPSPLQHICRCVIRDILNKCWNLPCGIYSLKLPSVLKKYLDLLED